MSAATLIRRKGSTVTFYRPTPVTNADGSPGLSTWTLLGTAGEKVWFQPVTNDLAGRIYGAEVEARERGFYAGALTLAPGDGILVTAGRHAGKRFRVEESLAYDGSASGGHQDMPVVETDEVFA
jgi:hypothetical protein